MLVPLKRILFVALLLAAPVYATAPDSASLEALRAAAERGDADAQYELGILYEFGYDFPEHKLLAYAWYARAAAQGNAAAARRRDLLRGELGPADLDRARALLQTPASAAAGR